MSVRTDMDTGQSIQGEEEGGGRGAPLSSSPRKKRPRTTRHPSLSCRPRRRSPHSLLTPPPFPLRISLQIRIYPSLSSRGEEEARASPPPPPRKRRRRSARRSSPLPCRRCRSPQSPCSPPPSSHTLPATPTHPLRPDVCIVVCSPTG